MRSVSWRMTSCSSWSCWRCGGHFSRDIQYNAQVFDTEDPDKIVSVAPLCVACVENNSRFDSFLVLRQLANHQPVYWRLRLKILWKLLVGVRIMSNYWKKS